MMTNSNEDGVDKVLANRGGYVYIMESVSVDYEVSARLQQGSLKVVKSVYPYR